MLYSRGADFFFSRLKNDVFGHKSDTLCSSRADPILAFRAFTSVFQVKTLHTLCSTRTDPIFPINALKSMFLVIN